MADIRTKADFYNAAISEMDSGNYPALRARLRAGDVTITQQFGAMAQMLAMLSFQLGLAETEIWQKTRDNMILADASMKGILPFAVSAQYKVRITGNNNRIVAGRRLLDNRSRVWRVVDGGIATSSGIDVIIEQVDKHTIHHTIEERSNFYEIAIEQPNAAYLSSVDVYVDGEFFPRSYRFNNIELDEKVYQLAVDEKMNMAVRFGIEGIAGAVLNHGQEVRIDVGYTLGDVSLTGDLSFEYIGDNESGITIRAGEQVRAGNAPMSLEELRILAEYPFLYNDNAVLLGEFDFLIRKNIRGFTFLSVWNEVREEKVRGANIDNINTLFVSFINTDYSKIEAQSAITRIIQASDDSYKIKFVEPVISKIQLTVNMRLPVLYDEEPIKRQVKELLLAKYGKNSEFAKKGGRINWQNTVTYLKDNVYELSDGISDIAVNVVERSNNQPETFAYLDESTLTINNEPIL